MRGLASTLAVSAAALLLALPGRAVDAPTPDLSFSFTNSTAPSIGSLSWAWNNGTAVYVDSLRTESDGSASKAVTISDACHPGVGYTWPAEFSVMSYIKVTDAPDKGTVVSFGSGCFLLKQNATTMRFGTASAYVDATAENLSTGWHLVVAKRSGSGLSLQIDNGTAVTGRTAIEVGGGFQIGTRWTGPSDDGTAIQATNLYIDELAIYNNKVLSDTEVAALVAAYPALPKVYTADLSSSTETTVDYSALTWDVGSAPGANAAVVIKTPPAGITITLDSALQAFNQFTVQGDGKLVFATSAEITGTALSAAETVVNTALDVSAITTSLGTLSVATGKELTVGATTISDIDTTAKGSLVVKGAALYDKGDKNGVGLLNGRVVKVSGANASLSLKGSDSTGWTYADGQKIVLQEGGTLIPQSRETLITPLELCDGHLQLTAAQSNRAIDFFNGTATVTDLTVKAKDGETGETLSTLTSTGTDETAQIALIRQSSSDSNPNTFSIEVEDKARLRVDTILASSATYNNGNGDQTETGTAPLEKRGAGVLELTRENTYATGTTITGGKVLLTGVGTVGTGAVTIASDATLEIDATTNRDIANTISGSGTIAKRGAGVVALTAVSGAELKVSIQEGSLGIGTLRPAELTIAEGATVLVTPTEEEVTAGSLSLPAGVTAEQILIPGYSISGVSEGTVSFGVVGDVTWTPTADNQTWDDATLWSTDTVPTNGRLTINFSALTAPATVTIPAGTYFESTTFVGGSAAECALEIEVSSVLALGTVSETSGNVTLPIDVVNAQSAVTVNNGTLTVKTSGDSTLTTPLTGSATNGAFAKSGDGVLTLNAAVRMANKTVVKAGTLKMGTEALTSTGNDGALHDVDVLAGATLDVNGKAALWLNTVTLYEDATYANSGVAIGNTQRQLVGIVLKGNAKVSGANNFGLLASGYGATTLTLNGYTLTKEGAGNFWLYNTTVTGGTTSALAVSAGQFSVQGDSTKLAADVTLSTTKASGDALTKDGALKVNTGVTMTVAGRGSMLGGSGSLTVSDGATLKFTSTGDVSEATVNYSAITGTGTIHFSGSGYRTLPNTAALRFTSALAIKNDQTGGLVITQGNTAADPAIVELGSLSGASPFRADWDPRVNDSRILRIVQSKNTDHTGNLLTSADRLAKVVVAGAETATEKTLTLSGSTTIAKLLEIESTGSVNLTGSWAGAVTVSGQLAGTGTVSGTLTFNAGAKLDASAGPLTAEEVTCNGTVTVTLPARAAVDTIILNCSKPGDIVGKLTATSMPTGLKFAANEAGTAVVLKKAGNYKVGDKTFETFEDALAEITAGATKTGTITIDAGAQDEITLTKQILVDDVAANITLDLGGKTLSAAKNSLTLATATDGAKASGVIWVRQGALTVKNGAITTDGRAIRVGVFFDPEVANPVTVDPESAVLTLESTLESTLSVTSTGEYTVTAFQGAKVISAANITASGADYYALSGNGSASAAGNNNTTIEITGGVISNASGVALYHPQGGTLTISGEETFIYGSTALYARAGKITISGGTFMGDGPVKEYNATANGVPALGDAVVIDNHSSYQALEVTITGGSFSAQYGAPIASYSNGNADYPVRTGFVSGGKFNKAIAGSLCADGYCCVANSNTVTSRAYPWTIGTLSAISGAEIDTPEAKDVIGKIIAADTSSPTSVKVIAGTKSGAALPPAEVADALAIFGSSVTTKATENDTLKITVSYDFGIDSMKQTESGIVITAKVQKPNGDDVATAAFADGVTVTLVDEAGNVIATATPTGDTATFAALNPSGLVGKKLKVKATK